jgi:radical SAM superfamily enzyme YgiQ (UPF0313 family)
MRLTLIHPTIGRKAGQKYIRSWQMEPLPPAMIAGLTPKEVDIRFYDDRMETIPYDQPTDLVAISVETYTARRAYQIASEYRSRGVPVVMGGFHASLCPEEVSQYAEAVVIGEAEETWHQVLGDAERGTLKTFYQTTERPVLRTSKPDRSIFKGKRYLPLGLLEASRGCCFNCEFCAIQTVFHRTQSWRQLETLFGELEEIRNKPLIFFVDDNIGADIARAKDFFRALIPLKINWVSQMSIQAAYDEELLHLMSASGCQGVLIGFESLNLENLKHMKKGFNMRGGGFEKALANLRKFHIKLYITFVFGYDHDTAESFSETVAFARHHKFFMAAFNHLTPFPGTPLYDRFEREGRLLYEHWWLDETYRYNMIPFQPAQMTPEQLREGCLESRSQFYDWRSIWKRGFDRVNSRNFKMWLAYFWINTLVRREVTQRDLFPLGDETWRKSLLRVRELPAKLDVASPHAEVI